jgi:hypothetical protein
MSEVFNRFTEIVVLNSITNNIDDEKLDINKPFTLIEFLNYTKVLDNDVENFQNFNEYISKWNNTNFKKKTSFKDDIREQYINLFRELSLIYSSNEEKRYLQNIDFDDVENLSIAIPFYSKKIKDICLYYKEKRDTFNRNLRDVKNKGTTESLQDFIKSKIVDLFIGDDILQGVSTSLPVSSLQNNLTIEIEEGYDTFNDYYDLDPDKLADFYNSTLDRKKFFSSNTNNIKPFTDLDLDQAIINLINEKEITLSELSLNSPSINFDEVDLSLLDKKDYIDYSSGERDKLSILFQAELVKNLLGTDYYYLSSNTEGEYLSGKLFDSVDKQKNILNINYPSTLTIPSTSNSYEREVGLFFKPTNFSIIKMSGGFDSTLKKNLSTNALFVFPDPSSFGDISGLSKSKRETPFDFVLKDDVFKNKSSLGSQKNVKSDNKSTNFYAYNSFEQFRNTSNLLSSFNTPINNLTNKGKIENITTDIFGNKFIEYLDDSSFVQNIDASKNFTRDKIYFTGAKTLTAFKNKSNKFTEFNKKTQGKTVNVFVQNISTNVFEPLSTSFSEIFKKYENDTLLYNELNNNIKNINIFEDSFSIDTKSFSLIDSFNYNGKFFNKPTSPLKISLPIDDDKFSSISNDFIKDNRIFKVLITLIPEASATNTRFFFEFFGYDLNNKIEIPIINKNITQRTYFQGNFNMNIDVSFKRIRSSNLSFSSKLNHFNLITQFHDLNENFYIHNLLFKVFNNELSIVDNTLFSPDNFFKTTNFFTTDLSSNYFTTTLSGSINQNKDKGIIEI